MLKIEVSDKKEFQEYVWNGLVASNEKKCQWFQKNPASGANEYKNFFAFDEGKLIGGAIGFILYEWYFLEGLWIKDSYQSQKVGTSLMKKVEEYVKKEKLIGIRLETWDFQAKGFYEKLGYTMYGTIEDCPPGTINYFFKKKFYKNEEK